MPSLNTKLATAPNVSANYVLKATTSTTIGNSLIFDNGTNTAIGGTTITDVNMLNVIGNQSTVNVGLILNNTNGTYPRIYAFQNVNNNLNIRDYTASADRLTINSSGNVGIGTSSPNAAAYAGRVLTIGNGTAYENALELNGYNITDDTLSDVAFLNGASSDADKRVCIIRANRSGANNSGALLFYTKNSGTFGERMRISNSGCVNIGNPTGDFGKLDVGGQTNGANQEVCRIGNVVGINNGLLVRKNTSNVYTFDYGADCRVAIGNPSDKSMPLSVQGYYDQWTTGVFALNSTGKSYGSLIYAGTNSADYTLYVANVTGANVYFAVRGDGYLRSNTTYNNTTTNGANVSISSSGFFERSTSSIRYKTNVEDLTVDTTSILSQMRPIWYRSLGQNDRKDWSWYGFIAEELAEVEPRLVHWGYPSEDYITNEETKETILKEGSELRPDGVQYERITVLLVAEIQKMSKQIQELNTKLQDQQQKINSLINR